MLSQLFLAVAILYLLDRLLLWICRPYLARPLTDGELKGEPEKMKFPKGFSFGSATAAWQIEKDVQPSNWSLFEKQFRADGKTPCCPPHLDACDAIAKFDEDLQIMKNMNMTSYRFGLSWSALNPADGQFDSSYLEHYKQMCRKLKASGIEPLITIWHFEVPAWLEERGGLIASEFKEKFAAFAEFAVDGLKDECQWWFTINEPAVYPTMAFLFGEFAPGHKSWSEFKTSLLTLMECHVIAYKTIHKLVHDAKVGIAKQIVLFMPIHPSSGLEALISYGGNSFFNFPVMNSLVTGILEMSVLGIKLFSFPVEDLKDSFEFIGINHYTAIFVSYNPVDWSGRKECPVLLSNYERRFQKSDFGWTLAPESLAITLEWVNKKWNKRKVPIIVSEHGIADKADDKRQWFTIDSLAYLQKSIENNKLPVIKYLHWSLLDNYEWADGYTQHFGLVAVNLDTQERTPRKTCDLLGCVAANTLNQ